jgi:hypothetical protein
VGAGPVSTAPRPFTPEGSRPRRRLSGGRRVVAGGWFVVGSRPEEEVSGRPRVDQPDELGLTASVTETSWLEPLRMTVSLVASPAVISRIAATSASAESMR